MLQSDHNQLVCLENTQEKHILEHKLTQLYVLKTAQQDDRPLVGLSALLLYSEQSEHNDSMIYSRTISLWKWDVFNSIQVTNYWFTLHCTLRSLYQQAQTFSFNIQGISDQNVTKGVWWQHSVSLQRVAFLHHSRSILLWITSLLEQ
jgi:hypothetical protein